MKEQFFIIIYSAENCEPDERLKAWKALGLFENIKRRFIYFPHNANW